MSAHTPGPWKVENMLDPIFDVVADDGIVCACDYRGDKENDANARLIAAAPELLEAVKEFHNGAMPGDPWSREFLHMVEALIAKAEGRQ